MEIQELLNKIEELQERVNKLEKIERRRKNTKLFKVLLVLIVIGVVGVFIYKGYKYINDNYLKPIDEIKEKVDIKDTIKEESDNIYNKLFKKTEE